MPLGAGCQGGYGFLLRTVKVFLVGTFPDVLTCTIGFLAILVENGLAILSACSEHSYSQKSIVAIATYYRHPIDCNMPIIVIANFH